jgi:hypothetical protein
MSPTPSIPEELWAMIPSAAQAALLAVFEQFERRVAELEMETPRRSPLSRGLTVMREKSMEISEECPNSWAKRHLSESASPYDFR